MKSVKLAFVVALLSVWLLTGAQCAFVAKSGTSTDSFESENDSETRNGLTVLLVDGRLVDSPVQGVGYRSGSASGITGANGEFKFEPGYPVSFFIGDIVLGEAVRGKSVITPVDLIENGTIDTPAVINIARLLQSLDSIRGDGVITIPEDLRRAVIQSGDGISSSIGFLDFSDDDSFNNLASQLVATLTSNYPFTAVLVDAQTAQAHLRDTLSSLQGQVRIDPVAP